jgi:NDP-sugar pyrophosphorylase family protein
VAGAEIGPVCILAGGLGSRLGETVRTTPKPLLEVAGRPFLDWQLQLLAGHGVRRAVLCVGYLGERIEASLGERAHGIELVYRYDPPQLAGTAGAIRGALDALGDAFLVLYGYTYLRVDYRAAWDAFVASGLEGLWCVLRNEGRWDTSNIVLSDDERRVALYDKRPEHRTDAMRWIDYGVGALRADALTTRPDLADLSALQQTLAAEGQLGAYVATERFYEIGTPAALAETDAFLRQTIE